MSQTDIWQHIAEYARHAPSPHNTQPFRLRVIDGSQAEVVFIPSRGLYVGDPEGRFTWLAGGIFVEICRIVANHLGCKLTTNWQLKPMYAKGDHQTPQTVASLKLEAAKPNADFDAALILERQTSRLPYDGRPIPATVLNELRAEARQAGHELTVSTDPDAIAWVKQLNKNALFNDLNDKGIREELKLWLRYSRKQARVKGDGLSALCLHLPGPLLRSFFYHHRFWTLPVVRQVVEKVYLSTMKGIGTIGWLRGPYVTRQDWVEAGRVMIRLWLILTKHGVYWHPYGSVITNDASRQEMLEHLGLPDEAGGKRMVWLLLRMGYSQPPPRSERLRIEDILIT